MIKILRAEEGKIVKIDTDVDLCLYKAPVNPPNTGTNYTRGRDLYVHTTKKGSVYFYVYEWSMWDRESDSIFLVSEKEARELLINKAGVMGWGELSEDEIETAEKFFPGIFEETA